MALTPQHAREIDQDRRGRAPDVVPLCGQTQNSRRRPCHSALRRSRCRGVEITDSGSSKASPPRRDRREVERRRDQPNHRDDVEAGAGDVFRQPPSNSGRRGSSPTSSAASRTAAASAFPGLDPAAGKAHLAGMGGHPRRAQGQQHGRRAVVQHDRHQHRGGDHPLGPQPFGIIGSGRGGEGQRGRVGQPGGDLGRRHDRASCDRPARSLRRRVEHADSSIGKNTPSDQTPSISRPSTSSVSPSATSRRHGAADLRFQPRADWCDVGPRLPRLRAEWTRIGCSALAVTISSRLVRKVRHLARRAVAAIAILPAHLDRHEGRILDLDPATLDRGFQQKLHPAGASGTLANKQTSSFRLIGLPLVVPGAVAVDPHLEVAACLLRPWPGSAGPSNRLDSGRKPAARLVGPMTGGLAHHPRPARRLPLRCAEPIHCFVHVVRSHRLATSPCPATLSPGGSPSMRWAI